MCVCALVSAVESWRVGGMLVWDCQCVCVRVTIVSPNEPATLDKKFEDDLSCASVRF
jgi:hypothetical protein